MGGWGRQNPWPIQWGGGRSTYEQAWMALRSMLGPKGPGPIGGLEDAWREAKVSGLVKVLTMPERAALQAIPQSATDHLPVYEDLLGLSPRPTDQERREAISLVWSGALSALIPELRGALQDIDADLDVILPLDIDKTANFQLGQVFRTAAAEFGTWPSYQYASAYPNYANHFILYVLYSNQPVATGPDANKIADVEDLLRARLPGWVDYVIITSVGFLAGTSPVGWTGLAEEPIRELLSLVTVTDSVAVSAYSVEGVASDAVAATDSVARVFDASRTISEGVLLALDVLAASAYSFLAAPSDSAAAADSATVSMNLGVAASDAAAVTDSVSRQLL